MFLLLLLIMTACQSDQEKKNPGKPKIESPSIHVSAAIARIGTIEDVIRCSAKLSAYQKGEVKSLASSTIREIFIKNGSWVKQGDTLVILDDRFIRNQLEKYRSDFMKAVSTLVIELESSGNRNAFERWRQYQISAANSWKIPEYPKPESPQMTVMLSRLQVQYSYNMVKEYELQLENCTITAPFEGIVSELEVYPSLYLSSGMKICKLTDLSRLRVEIDILEEDIGSIQVGNKVEIYGNNAGPFYIDAVYPSIDGTKHTGVAVVVIDNPGLRYKDGQYVQVLVTKTMYRNRIVIPRKALLIRNERHMLFVVKDGIAKWKYVDIGVGNADNIEIVNGIEPGDSVIVEGHYSLGHNVRVIVDSVE